MQIAENVGFREFEKHGFYYLQTCYIRDIDEEWCLRLDIKKRELKCWSIKTGKTRSVNAYIKDLINAGLVVKENKDVKD